MPRRGHDFLSIAVRILIGCVFVVKLSNEQFATCCEVVAQDISYPEGNEVAECGDALFLRSGLTNLTCTDDPPSSIPFYCSCPARGSAVSRSTFRDGSSAIDTWVVALRVRCPRIAFFLHTNVSVFFELERQYFEQRQLGAKAVQREKQRKLPQWRLLGCKLKAVQSLSVSVSDMSEFTTGDARSEAAEHVAGEVDTRAAGLSLQSLQGLSVSVWSSRDPLPMQRNVKVPNKAALEESARLEADEIAEASGLRFWDLHSSDCSPRHSSNSGHRNFAHVLADLSVFSAENVLAEISSALRLSACWRSWEAEAEFKGCSLVLWSDALRSWQKLLQSRP